jgi:hypothetical protein
MKKISNSQVKGNFKKSHYNISIPNIIFKSDFINKLASTKKYKISLSRLLYSESFYVLIFFILIYLYVVCQ